MHESMAPAQVEARVEPTPLERPTHRPVELSHEPGSRIDVLFLGDRAGHQPAERAKQLIPMMLDRNIHMTYTEDVERALTRETLDRYHVLFVYANIDTITDSQAEALLGYVADGGGFVPVHSASYCFRNNDDVVALIGGQFRYHGPIRTFSTRIVEPDHPIMQGLDPIESADEPYEHTLHNEENRTVLSYRDDEPYTWIRTHGEGRVFYTAWGHDQRTWSHPGFHDLIERGIRWSAGRDVQAELEIREIRRPFEYIEQEVAYYPPPNATEREWNRVQKTLTPEESMERVILPGGFELQLFASEPDIRKPITMAWDERGRLWVAETIDYPNELRPAGEGRDRLTILEDTTGDGRADKFTVFAENLSIPTGIAFANGGVLIYHAPDTIFLKDTTGDDRADHKEVIFTGWGTGDTHAQASNLRYGFDNWFWGVQGYSGFNGEVGDQRLRFGSGFHRFTPDGSTLEFMRTTNNNTWGLGFGEDGIVFGSTANNNPSVLMPFPNRYFEDVWDLRPNTSTRLAGTSRFLFIRDRIRQVDVHGGYTAAAGHALYTARTWPQEYWNRIAFVTDATGHMVGEFVLEPNGAAFQAVNDTNLLVSDDEWFAPIMAEVGPDGHVWVIDWYNYIIQHNPTPRGYQTGRGNAYITDLRDQRHGRIYRVVYTGAEPYEPISLHDAAPEKLLESLAHHNLLWRKHAQRLLVERGETDVVPDLIDLVRNEWVDEIGLNVGAVHALWTLHGLGAMNGGSPEALAAAANALNHPSAAVRRNAAAVLPPTAQTGRAILAANILEDENAQVRLAALLALSEVPSSRLIGQAIYRMHDREDNRGDRILEDALIIAIHTHQDGFIASASADGRFDPDQEEEEETDAVNLIPNPSLAQVENGQAVGWTPRNYGGSAQHSVVPEGRNGGYALRIDSESGADTSFYTDVQVNPNTVYELSAWIKTENVRRAAGGLLNIHGWSREQGGTNAVNGTRDWERVHLRFNSGSYNQISINALFGGWGQSIGTVWYDDFELIEIGPAGVENRVLAFLVEQFGDGIEAASIPAGYEDALEIRVGVVPDVLLFDIEEFSVPAGTPIRLVFENPDHMPHNFLIINPGTLNQIGELADAMIMDPRAEEKHYVPDSPDVLAWTPILDPDETFELFFTAPEEPGEYPFVCTFPGHWRIMNGVMTVE